MAEGKKKKETQPIVTVDEETGEIKRIPGTRFAVQFEFEYKGSQGKYMDGKSKTVPDLNLSIKQLMENHTRDDIGNIQAKRPIYFETTIPKINDLTDVERYRDRLQEQVNKANDFIKQEQNEKDEKAKEMGNTSGGATEKDSKPATDPQK